MMDTTSEFYKLRMADAEPSDQPTAVKELLLGPYFIQCWDDVLKLDMEDDPELAEFIITAIKTLDLSDINEQQQDELKIIFQFLHYHRGRDYAKAISTEFRQFADSDISLEQFYGEVDETESEADYEISSKCILLKIADYLDSQI